MISANSVCIMGDRRRVVHIAPGEPFGGVQRVVIELATAQRTKECDVAVIWTGSSGLAAALSTQRGVPTETAEGSLPCRLLAVRSGLKRLAPDIVHLHMAPPWIALALPFHRTLCCVHIHGQRVEPGSLKAKVSSMLEARLIRRADVVIAISSWILQQWQAAHPSEKFTLVYNGVPTSFAGIKLRHHVASDRPTIGFASRLAPDKGVQEFINIVLEMSSAIPKARFIVAGDGTEKAEIERRLAQLIATGAVELRGFVGDMPDFWAQLDLAVFCAPNEPFGLRLIEPLVHNVPVIAYRTGAGSDEVADLCAGIETVPYGDVKAITAIGRALLLNVGRRSSIAAAGRFDVETQFSVKTMVDRIDDIYSAEWDRRFGA